MIVLVEAFKRGLQLHRLEKQPYSLRLYMQQEV